MIKDVIRRLQKASVRPNDFTSRYSELLDRLWQRKDTPPQMQASSSSTIHNVINDTNPSTSAPSPSLPDATPYNIRAASNGGVGGGYMGQQDEFSWLDLQAVGELVTGEPGYGGAEGYSQGGYMTMGGGWDSGDQVTGSDDFNRFF
jgi:hypothetical protein